MTSKYRGLCKSVYIQDIEPFVSSLKPNNFFRNIFGFQLFSRNFDEDDC